jgi:uncharacterized membrane protein (UPF0136 family)
MCSQPIDVHCDLFLGTGPRAIRSRKFMPAGAVALVASLWKCSTRERRTTGNMAFEQARKFMPAGAVALVASLWKCSTRERRTTGNMAFEQARSTSAHTRPLV